MEMIRLHIRPGIFETNSSSTHSLSIQLLDPEEGKLPRNGSFIVEPMSITATEEQLRIVAYSEQGKARLMFNVLLQILWDKNIVEYGAIPDSNNLLQWFVEALEEETGSTIKLEAVEEDTASIWDEDSSLEEAIQLPLNNESAFKARIKEIIFKSKYTINYLIDQW